MKPAPFSYVAPTSLEEALGLLADENEEEAKLIAGGQSLIPLLALRFAQPTRLIDLNRVAGMTGISRLPDGGLAIKAMTRIHTLETDASVRERALLVAEAVPFIAHRAIRNRGTAGGSVAHADPAAELPAVLLALDATMLVAGLAGERQIRAREFFQGVYATALEPAEILTELRIPSPPPGSGAAFLEQARRAGDFAMAGVAATVSLDGGRCVDARITLIGVADRPVLASEAATVVVGTTVDRQSAVRAGDTAAANITPGSDHHASGEYRRALVAVLVRRALLLAAARARAEIS